MAGSSSSAVFQWGNKESGTDSSYESMCYYGVWYTLYDSVFCTSGMREPFVGKLMRLFQDEEGVRKVRIRWFFRPYELPVSVLKGFPEDIASSNELFVALGSVKGVENENVVEVIRGKAAVLCTARYGGNLLPPAAAIAGADHVFNRAYDVAKQKVVKMANIESKQLGQKLANKQEWLKLVENRVVEEDSTTMNDDVEAGLTTRNKDVKEDSTINNGNVEESMSTENIDIEVLTPFDDNKPMPMKNVVDVLTSSKRTTLTNLGELQRKKLKGKAISENDDALIIESLEFTNLDMMSE